PLVYGGHHHPVGWDAEHKESIIIRAAAIEVETTTLDSDESFGFTSTEDGRIAPIETNDVTGRQSPRPIPVFVHPKAMDPRVTLPPEAPPVVCPPAAVEVVAAPAHEPPPGRPVQEDGARGCGDGGDRSREGEKPETAAPRRNDTLQPFATTQPPQQL